MQPRAMEDQKDALKLNNLLKRSASNVCVLMASSPLERLLQQQMDHSQIHYVLIEFKE